MTQKTAAIELADLHQTLVFGRQLGRLAQPGDVITLEGALGVGKTTLTQAIGRGLEVPEQYYITSPTFGLLHDYPGRIPLYHMDLYRISSEEELEDLGFEEYLYGKGLAVVEWPDRLGGMLPSDRLHIELFFALRTARTARITIFGKRWQERFSALTAK